MNKCTTILLNLVLLFVLAEVPGQTMEDSLLHDNIFRHYRIHLPVPYNPADTVPLVINLHGLGSNSFEQEFYSRFSLISDTAGFIVVYPDGELSAWNAGLVIGGVDDLGFISALIDTIGEKYHIDPARVYATGMSNGGFMSHFLACELSGRIAAIASVAGTMTQYVHSVCEPLRPVPVMHIHGTADQVVPYEGDNFFYMAVDSVMRLWAGINQCTLPPDSLNLPDLVNEGSEVVKFDYGYCLDSTELILFRVDSGGHTWPGAEFLLPNENTNQDIDASLEIWEFFSRHRHPSPLPILAAIESTLPQSKISVFPNPASGNINLHIQTDQSGWLSLEVVDIHGKVVGTVAESPIIGREQSLRIATDNLPAGVYFIKISLAEEMLIRRFVLVK